MPSRRRIVPVPMVADPPGPPARGTQALWLVGLAYAATGLAMMLAAAPRVPFADQYRFLARFLLEPFPDSVVAADNGHREVLPNLVRVAELSWLDANQWLQLGVGLALAVATLWTMIGAFRHGAAHARAAAAALVCIGVCWLGNARKLAHANESVHLFLVLLCLAVGLRALAGIGRDRGGARAFVAAGAGLLATLSFGSGPACFAAFAVVLTLQRARWQLWLPVLTAALLGALALLHGGGGAGAAPRFMPLLQLEQLLRWLGAPSVWALSPLLDPAHAARLPTALLSGPATAIAGPLEAALGPRLVARWPAAAFGGAGTVWLVVATWRAFRAGGGDAARRFALGLAWFGWTVGVLVVLLRPAYFDAHRGEVVATRYVPWSMLFWTGLGTELALRARARAALLGTLTVAAVLLPSQVWTGRNAFKLQETAELTAVGVAVGVLDREFALGETRWPEVVLARPLLRDHGAAMFAWPETQVLGERVAATRLVAVLVTDVEVTPVPNRFAADGSSVRLRSATRGGRLLLLDDTGVARGIVTRVGSDDRWQGWLQGGLDAGPLRAARLAP